MLDSASGPNLGPRAAGVTGQGPRPVDHRGLYEQLSGTCDRPRPIAEFSFGALPMDFRETVERARRAAGSDSLQRSC